jgi:hypothetical protein
MLKLSISCTGFENNYNLQLGAVKIYVAAVEWRRSEQKERGDETHFTTKIGGKN